MAAAHGSQWAVQMMRLISSNNGSLPEPQIASISFGTLSKQPLEEMEHSIPRGNVKPFQHSERSVQYSISKGDVNSTEVVETIALLAKDQDWPTLWRIADSMKREVSGLFDSKGRIFVDVGTQGEVAMSPPIGAEIPFMLWVHTHPWDSYWSETDRNTISCYSEILEEAIVLGHDHYKRTRPADPNDTTPRLSRFGPLFSWTEEELVPYLSTMDVME